MECHLANIECLSSRFHIQKQQVNDKKPPMRDCHESMTLAKRLKRVFNIDITVCSRCAGAVNIITCIEDPSIINKILSHLDAKPGGTGHSESNTKATGRATGAIFRSGIMERVIGAAQGCVRQDRLRAGYAEC